MGKISLIRKSQVIREVPDRWAGQYHRTQDPDKIAITKQLAALVRATMTAEQVNVIIGNKSWTATACDVCDLDFDILVRIGEEPDYEARWQDVCMGCLKDAVFLLSAELKP